MENRRRERPDIYRYSRSVPTRICEPSTERRSPPFDHIQHMREVTGASSLCHARLQRQRNIAWEGGGWQLDVAGFCFRTGGHSLCLNTRVEQEAHEAHEAHAVV